MGPYYDAATDLPYSRLDDRWYLEYQTPIPLDQLFTLSQLMLPFDVSLI